MVVGKLRNLKKTKMTKGRSFILVTILLLTTTYGCCQNSTRSLVYTYQEPSRQNDSINTGNLTNVGMDSSQIIIMTKRILADSISNVHSLLIYKENKLVYENYFSGNDQRHGQNLGYIDHAMSQLHDCRSISKSVVSACIGIALKNKLIANIDDPIIKYFPEIKDSLKATITIRHLLTMTSGLGWNEIGSYGSFFNSETQMDLRFSPVKYILKQSMVAQPGTRWNYSAGNTQLLAEIIYRTSGLRIDKFAEKHLFLPLGIKNYEWITLSLKKIPAAASGLRLASRELLKIGLLYMNHGSWNGFPIMDSSWVAQSFKPYMERPDLRKYKLKEGGYGFQFWTYTDTLNRQPVEVIEAKGNGGQSIFFCRKINLLIVTTGGNYNKDSSESFLMLVKFILPSIQALDDREDIVN